LPHASKSFARLIDSMISFKSRDLLADYQIPIFVVHRQGSYDSTSVRPEKHRKLFESM
jgi:hypothetical protein